MKYFLLLSSLFVGLMAVQAQTIDLANGIVGNEWIDYNKSYVKIEITKDDVYTLNYEDLINVGVPIESIDPRSIRIHHFGNSVPLYTSAGFNFDNDDYIIFYGVKNRAELDTFLFENANQNMLNNRHSMVNDTSGYFLSWGHPAATDRIQKRAIDYNQPLPEQRVYNHKEERVYANFHYKPVENSDKVRYSSMRKGEGFGALFTNSFTESFNVVDKVNVGIDPTFSVRFGTNRNELNTKIILNGNTIEEFFNPGFRNHLIQYETSVNYATIVDKVDVELSSSKDSRVIAANMQLEYTRTIDASKGFPNVIEVLANAKDQHFKIKNYTGEAPQVLNISTNQLYDTEIVDNNLIVFLPASSINQKIAIVDNTSDGIKLNAVRQFQDFSLLTNKDYVIITSKRLNNNDGGNNPVLDYADYRSSADGGGYNSVVVNIEDLYDQFSFGINRHFLALRHFAFFIKKKWDEPKFIFIIGKGREYANTRYDFQLEDPQNESFYVPTYGVPGSDNLITAGVNEPTLIIPIGRIAATNKADIEGYLDKIVLHEAVRSNPQTIEDKLWTKNVLHMSGGDKDIQEDIRKYLESMEEVIEDSEMAAKVTTFYKFSSDPQQVALSEGLQSLINNGVSVLTFFGHSAVGVLDFSIGNVSDFNNYGKYPFAVALGCSSGNIHTVSDEGVSEEYVLTKDKGSIAFLASSSSAYAAQQYNYGLKFYELLGDSQYGAPIGTTINAVIDSLKENSIYLAYATFLEQLTLHGDPALSIYAYGGPDFIPNEKTATTNPINVNSYESDFEFCVDIANVGSLYRDSFMVNVKHLYDNGTIAIDTSIRIAAPIYNDQVCINIPILDNAQVGEQTILFKVDSENEVNESPIPEAENNNELRFNGVEGYKFYVINNTARPIYPQEFAIIDDARPTLIASTFNAFGAAGNYYIQFDTTGSFDSPLLVETKLENQRSSIFWETPFDLTHNTVYFWRISPDTTANIGEMLWVESSFLYHKDIPEGWNQSHYHQFIKDDFENMVLNPSSRKLEYTANFIDYTIENRIWNNATDRPHYYTNGDSRNVPFTRGAAPGISVSIVDSLGRRIFTDYPDDEAEYGTFNDRNQPMMSYLFNNINKEEVRQNLIRLIENTEEGMLIVINTIIGNGAYNFKTEEWAADSISNEFNIYYYLESHGATKIRDLEQKGGVPYVFAFKKGGGVLNEDVADDINGEIIVKFLVKGVWFKGNVNSTVIGPAKEWKGVNWSEQRSVNEQNDSTYIKIYGITTDGIMTILRDSVTDKNIDISNVNAEQFPFIQLGFYSKDEMDRTSSNLIRWNTILEGEGDLTIQNNDDFSVYADTLQEGDAFKFTLPIYNYLNKELNEINAIVSVKDLNNKTNEQEFNLGTFAPGETKNINFQFDTEDNLGDYIANVEVNKEKNPSELYYFNNFASQQFHVFREKINPVLDVTFDGVHILDNDIVSAKPIILVDLKDENPYLLLNEPDLFKIYLTSPDGTVDSLKSDDPRISFIPATDSQNNQAKIEISPTFQLEGNYTLKVQSMDRSENLQGVNKYEVQFRVVLEEAISEVYNYPNPFSTSTEFIFTLTGSTLPENIAIQIMTISGKVVKEIRKEELGPLKIGVNRTAYKWDGTDEFGSKLGNGVYLYRMIVTQENGEAYKSFDVGIDPSRNHFKKGWGKMVIMR